MIAIARILFVVALAASALRAGERFSVERLTTKQGLSQSLVYGVFQDREGFLWFGTRDGLNRYDGYRFAVFRHEPFDAGSLPETDTGIMAEDGAGNIWMVVNTGVARLDRRTFTFTHFVHSPSDPHSLSSNTVNCLLGDRSGTVWIGTDHGLDRFDARTGGFTRFHADGGRPDALGNDLIASLYQDRAGRLWVGTRNGFLHRFDRGGFVRFDTGLDSATEVLCLGENRRGELYCSSNSDGKHYAITLLDPASGAIRSRWKRPSGGYYRNIRSVRPLCIDSLGGLWIQVGGWLDRDISVATRGVFRLQISDSAGAIALSGIETKVLAEPVWDLRCDRSGTIWAGTESGVAKLTLGTPRFVTYRNDPSDPASLSNDHIRSIQMDRTGALWVGTDMGLNRLDGGGGRWNRYLHRDGDRRSLSENTVNVILEDSDGSLLIGTNDGLNVYHRQTNTFSPYCRVDVTPFQVWSLMRDTSGILWVGTRGRGIMLFDRSGALVRRFVPRANDSTTIAPGLVWDIHRDRYGVVWVATSSGLYRWLDDRNIFRSYRRDAGGSSGLSDDNVCAILEDSGGRMWFSTYGGGLNRYNREHDSFTHITARDGLASNALYGALPDDAGRLWISSNVGLTAYDPATGHCRVYNSGDGMLSDEFSFRAFHRTRHGELLFGGPYGVTRFHPDSLRASQRRAPIVITEFRVFDAIARHELAERDTVAIDHDQGFVSFEFAALDYNNTAGIRYAYRLAGFDNDWIYCGDRRYASFTNLDPGTYTFLVKGTNGDGVWNDRPFQVVLRVVPPYWMTLWFKGAVCSAIVLLAGAGAFFRIRSVRGKEILRRRSVESQLQALRLQVNPHFIFNALGSIQHLILITEPERAVEYLSRFARLVGAVLENSERTFIPIAEELENLQHYLHLESLRFEGRFSYTITIDPTLDTHHVSIPTMLIQPYVENAIRHGLLHKAGTGTLAIAIERRGALIRCVVEDDGVGRKRAGELGERRPHRRRSMGMRVTEERLRVLNAAYAKGESIRMEITDLVDAGGAAAGTRVEMFIPVTFL